jgi:hypothetical protein
MVKTINTFANTPPLPVNPFLTPFYDCRKIYERVTTCQVIRISEAALIRDLEIQAVGYFKDQGPEPIPASRRIQGKQPPPPT